MTDDSMVKKWQDEDGYWHFMKGDMDITHTIPSIYLWFNDWAHKDSNGSIYLIKRG